MAGANGMACLYESASDPYYERVEQYKVSDIKFLSQLCHDAGISLKATNNILVLFDQADYEAKDPTFTVKRAAGATPSMTCLSARRTPSTRPAASAMPTPPRAGSSRAPPTPKTTRRTPRTISSWR